MPKYNNAQMKGFDELHRKLIALGQLEGGKVLRAAATQATTPVVNEARSRIPVREVETLAKTYTGRKVAPGFAKRSIAKKVILVKDKSRAYSLVGVKPEAYYATQYVELGTSKQRKQPWLAPSFRGSRPVMISRLGNVIDRKIKAIAKKKDAR